MVSTPVKELWVGGRQCMARGGEMLVQAGIMHMVLCASDVDPPVP